MLSPSNDPGRFNLQIDTATQKADAANGDTTGKQTVSAATHSVGETAGTASSLSDYTSAIVCKDEGGTGAILASGSDAGPLNVSVAEGADVVCTITNTRKSTPTGQLEVRKVLSPSNDPGRFNLQIDTTTKKADAANGDTTGKQTVSAATHSVGETAGTASSLSDYTSAIVCKDEGGTGAILASGSDAGPLNVSVAEGADVVCTITNTRKSTPTGQLEVRKVLSPSNDPGRFNLQIDTTTKKADAANGDTTGKQTVSAATHSVGETAGTASSLSDYTSAIVCKDEGGTGAILASGSDAGPLNVSVAEGADVVCTITNTRKSTPTGQLEVRKVLSPSNDPGRFNLQIDTTTKKADAANGDTTGKQTVSAATHSVGETAGTASSLSDYTSAIVCKDEGGTGAILASGSDAGPLNVSVAEGADVVCTITNTRKSTPTGQLEVRKVLSPSNDPGRFNLQIDTTTKKADAANGDTTGKQTVSAATHSVGETAGTASSLSDYTSAIVCKDEGGTGAILASGSDAGPLNVSVAEGADVVCTITNTRKVQETPPPTTTSTSLSGGGQSGSAITVPEGAAVTDKATLSGENAALATGEISYKVYSDSACTKLVVNAGTVRVTGDFIPASNPQMLARGTYYWQASYSGDSSNGASKSACGSEVEKVTAANPPITAAPKTIKATEGAAFCGVVATFKDTNKHSRAGEYKAAIDWGDGSSTTVGTISGKHGSFSVSGGHTYDEEGSYTITVTITDIDTPSNTATASSTANVADDDHDWGRGHHERSKDAKRHHGGECPKHGGKDGGDR